MSTNDNNYNISNSVFNSQLKTLLSIKNFEASLENHKSKVEQATQKLILTYEHGIDILESEGDKDHQANWSDALNEVRVHANHLNQYMMVAQEKSEQNKEFPFKELWNEFEERLKLLKEAAQKFENVGAKALSEERKQNWSNEIAIFETDVEPEIERNGKAVKLILQFMVRYSPAELEKMSAIIAETTPEGASLNEEKDYEAAFLKYLRQFQKEFEAKDNLWDTIMEILAGGVHPSPSERVMLDKWIDGEEKIREDM